MKIIYTFLLILCCLISNGQTIEILFPKFAGKTYEFIIFQGGEMIKVKENDTITKNGLVKIEIPAKYAPYTGMCRWLITNTTEGGGLDMAISGHGFKVSCLSDQPNESNIVWDGYDAMNELNRLNGIQQNIIDKYEAISKVAQLYGNKHPLYSTFINEQKIQQEAFELFKKELLTSTNYNARFLPIVNLVRGIAPILSTDATKKAKSVDNYITNELNFDQLYTSGHWTSILQSWVQIHAQVLQNKDNFSNAFNEVSKRITDPTKYTDFTGKVTYYLSLYGKDDYITAITPTVVGSGKITSYVGKTMEVYVKALVGNRAPSLIITDKKNASIPLESTEFAKKEMAKTLLVFYKTGCGPCDVLLSKLPLNYQLLQSKGFDVIGVSADEDERGFIQAKENLPWQRNYCDLKGTKGPNFVNYAVMGTPTIYVIDKKGIIESKLSSMEEIMNLIK